MVKTFSATPSDIQQDWYVIDAEGMVLGRLATEVARIIRGKHKPIFTPHMDTGDGVIVINASKVRVTGRKAEQKQYFHHTGYMGHERFTPFASMIAKHPERVIEKAVERMVPRGPLGRRIMSHLRVYPGTTHPHEAQNPTKLDVGAMNRKNKRA
jgi:large subunit ribosomal protein L13